MKFITLTSILTKENFIIGLDTVKLSLICSRTLLSSTKDDTHHNNLVCATPQSLQADTTKDPEDAGVYSVPIDVLQTISKDFNHLQAEFEKSNENCDVSIDAQDKRNNEQWLTSSDPPKRNTADGRKTLRIKSIRTIKANQAGTKSLADELEDVPPPGTVARVEIRTDRARNKTIFTISPAIGALFKGSIVPEPHSFSVNTCNLAKATKLIKPLHLERLPILRDILETSIKTVSLSQPSNDEMLKTTERKHAKFDNLEGAQKEHLSFQDSKATYSEQNSCSIEDLRVSTQPKAIKFGSKPIKPDRIQVNSNITNFSPNTNRVVHGKKVEEEEFLRELEKHELYYDKIVRKDGNYGTNNCDKASKASWVCPETGCERNFPKLSKLKIHIFSHRNVRPYKCENVGCSWAFHTAFKLKRHQATAHGKDKGQVKYECKLEKCAENVKTFSSPYNLNQHLKRHARPWSYKCAAPGCEAAFQTKQDLKSHLKSSIHRSLILQNLESGAGPLESKEQLIMLPEHICYSCGKRFFNSKDLLKHLHQSHGEETATCSTSAMGGTVKHKYYCNFETCGKVFDQPSRLAAHARTHTGERPYPCGWESCGWSFRTASKLRRHERTHKNERKNACHLCDKAYFRPEHLKSHMLAIHNPSGNPERFACPLDKCGKDFSAKSTLCVHMKKHSQQQQESRRELTPPLWRCVIKSCDEKFYDRNELRKHVSLHHVQELAESTAKFSSNLEAHELGSTLGESSILGQQGDQETVTAAAELDFIALLSSVGDEDVVNINIPREDHMNKKIAFEKKTDQATTVPYLADDIKDSTKYGRDPINNVQDEMIDNGLNTNAQIKITEDQIISEMIIETLASASAQSEQEADVDEVNSQRCQDKLHETEKLQIPILSNLICKDEGRIKCEDSELPSVLITPFSGEGRPQNELVTVDASAITPVKLITQNEFVRTSNRAILESQAEVIPSLPSVEASIYLHHSPQVKSAQKYGEVQKEHGSENELSFINSSTRLLPPVDRKLTHSFKRENIGPNFNLKIASTAPNDKDKVKSMSVLKCKQQKTSLLLNSQIGNTLITKHSATLQTTTEPSVVSHMCNKASSEKKRPSILRRRKLTPAAEPNPTFRANDKRQKTTEPCKAALGMQCTMTETVMMHKKRSPKKQKLLNNTLENLNSDDHDEHQDHFHVQKG